MLRWLCRSWPRPPLGRPCSGSCDRNASESWSSTRLAAAFCVVDTAAMSRKDISMTDGELQAFFAEVPVVEVATNGRDGWPHLAPMWFVVDQRRLVFRSFSKSQKIINLRRDPRLTALLEIGDSYEELRGAMIKGSAQLVDDPAYVLGIYRRLAARYAMVGPEPVELDDDALEAAFGRFAAKNTAVIIEPRSVASWDHRKLGGTY